MDIKHVSEKLSVREATLTGSSFERVDLSDSTFSKVKLAGAPMREADLSSLSLHHWDLRNAAFAGCRVDGMTIDGIPVSVLLTAHAASRKS